MSPGMGGQMHVFDGPPVSLRKVIHGDPAIEIGGHHLSRILVPKVLDVRDLRRRIAGQPVLYRNG